LGQGVKFCKKVRTRRSPRYIILNINESDLVLDKNGSQKIHRTQTLTLSNTFNACLYNLKLNFLVINLSSIYKNGKLKSKYQLSIYTSYIKEINCEMINPRITVSQEKFRKK